MQVGSANSVYTSPVVQRTASNGNASQEVAAAAVDSFQSSDNGTFIHPDSMGKIQHLAFQLDDGLTQNVRNQVFSTWGKVFTHLDSDVKVTIAVENQKDSGIIKTMVKELGLKNPDRFKFVVTDDLNITMWARDQMLGLGNKEGGNTLMGQTTMRPHGDDEKLVPRIAQASPELKWDPDKRFQTDGGDEVSNPSHTFLGYNSLFLTAKRLYDSDMAAAGKPVEDKGAVSEFPRQAEYLDKAKEMFSQKYDRKIVVLGQDNPETEIVERPATFHVDMGTTPMDRDKVLVGDPSLALGIIGGMSAEERAAHNASLNKALGRPSETDTLGELVKENTETNPDLQHQFDDNARIIGQEGFQIGRLPYLQGPRGVTWVTYNNCLMESYSREDGSKVRRVFLPEYGLPKLDQAAEAVYKANGFEVIPLDLAALTAMRGAIRCISNVYDRQVTA